MNLRSRMIGKSQALREPARRFFFLGSAFLIAILVSFFSYFSQHVAATVSRNILVSADAHQRDIAVIPEKALSFESKHGYTAGLIGLLLPIFPFVGLFLKHIELTEYILLQNLIFLLFLCCALFFLLSALTTYYYF